MDNFRRMSATTIDDVTLNEIMRKKFNKDQNTEGLKKFSELYVKLLSLKPQMPSRNGFILLLQSIAENNMKTFDYLLSSAAASDSTDRIMQTSSNISLALQPERKRQKLDNTDEFKRYESFVSKKYTVSEKELMQDLLYVFQGIDGKFIKYACQIEQFQVTDPNVGISQRLSDHVGLLSELGWLVKKVTTFVEQNKFSTSSLTLQAFCHACQLELSQYFKQVAVLEAQMKHSFLIGSFAQSGMSSNNSSSTVDGMMSLRNLSVWVMEPLEKLKMLAWLCDRVQYQRGGAILSVLYDGLLNGNLRLSQMVRQILSLSLKPLATMIKQWMAKGEIRYLDPFDEFFVVIAKHPIDFWHGKFSLNPQMIPKFIDHEVAMRILSLGRNLNFIKQFSHSPFFSSENIRQQLDDRSPLLPHPSSSKVTTTTIIMENNLLTLEDFRRLSLDMDVMQAQSNQMVMEIFQSLPLHLETIKRCLLLGEGSFIQSLMDMLNLTLAKPISSIQEHSLTAALESCIRKYSSTDTDADFLSSHLGISLQSPSSSSSSVGTRLGWDAFSITYKVPSPINDVLTEESMKVYHRLFRFLWDAKRVEVALAQCWKEQKMQLEGATRQLKDLFYQIIHTRYEMQHFISNLQYYLMVEVVEASWNRLVAQLKRISLDHGDIFEVIHVHQQYLMEIQTKFLLNDEILSNIYQLFKTILAFIEFHRYLIVRDEVSMSIDKFHTKFSDLTADFHEAITQFMATLEKSKSDELQFLYNQIHKN